ncbi:hypothetical protein V6R21_21830 [Limibacter armeniacum]|uniref:hypothetical protein n=1 Tax=Limibacter armeniacum TaxID=466084 RepID=UPI002FE5D510
MILFIPSCLSDENSNDDLSLLDKESITFRGEDNSLYTGSVFNAYFPESDDGYDVIVTSDKPGLAQGKIEKDGRVKATITIVDLHNKPNMFEKYEGAVGSLDGLPMIPKGNKGTAVLVANRFQVQVRSIDPEFTEPYRMAWLRKFNISKLNDLAE